MEKRSGNIIKIVVGVLAIGSAAWIGWMNLGGESPQPDSIQYIDVTNGQVFRIRRAEVPSVLPGENPKTKAKTLVPIFERDGQYYVSERSVDVIRAFGKENKHVDVASRRVTIAK